MSVCFLWGLLLLCWAGTWCPAAALQDGQARLPPAGYNTWNAFGANINEQLIRDTVDLMVDLGLHRAGYKYFVLDDGWSDPERTEDGRLQADRERFPSGMKALLEYVESKGLLLGLYGDSGQFTCQGFPGSRGHEAVDAQTFADWGVSLLKYDNCFIHDELLERFIAMRDALNATGRHILYSLCEWGIGDSWLWGPQVAHTWRTTFDIHSNWPSVMQNLDESIGLARFAGPDQGWNDLDLLEVGNMADGVLSPSEERAHFALWALLKSPLFIAADLRSLSPSSLEVLKARELIGINQDELGVPGDLIWKQGPKEVYVAPLSDGGRAVVLHNRHTLLSQYNTSNITVRWEQLGYAADMPATVRDLYAERDVGNYTGAYTAQVHLHDVEVLRITPVQPHANHSDWRPWHGQPMYERHEEDEAWIPQVVRSIEHRAQQDAESAVGTPSASGPELQQDAACS